MNKNIFSLVSVFIFFVALLAACSRSTTTTTPSSDPTLLSMRFAKSDSFPKLSDAKFTIVNKFKGDTGLIYNSDSIAYGTEITAAVPVFTYNATPYSFLFHVETDTVDTFFYFKTGDSIDFTLQPLYLTVTAQDRKVTKTYQISPVVHTADPELFVWNQMSEQVVGREVNRQNVLRIGQYFYYLATDGLTNYAFKSADGMSWSAMSVDLLGDISDYVSAGDFVLRVDQSEVSMSTDWQQWSNIGGQLPSGQSFGEPLFWFDDALWVEVLKGSEMVLARVSADGIDFLDWLVPDDFPVEGFGSLVFKSASGRKRAMLVGGYDRKGQMLNSRWNIETTAQGYGIVNFSSEQKSAFDPIAGVALVNYNSSIYMFGGMGADNVINKDVIRLSLDDGMSWQLADTAHNSLPESFVPRYNMSALTTEYGQIFLFGGRSSSAMFSDVYRGVLNEVLWKQIN